MWEVIPMPETWMYVIAFPVFFVILGATSHLWNVWVESWCASVAARAEERMCFRIMEAQKSQECDYNGLPKVNGVAY